MAEIDRLNSLTGRIDLVFVERERTDGSPGGRRRRTVDWPDGEQRWLSAGVDTEADVFPNAGLFPERTAGPTRQFSGEFVRRSDNGDAGCLADRGQGPTVTLHLLGSGIRRDQHVVRNGANVSSCG